MASQETPQPESTPKPRKSIWWTPESPKDQWGFEKPRAPAQVVSPEDLAIIPVPKTSRTPSAGRLANLAKRPNLNALGVVNPATARDVHGRWRARYSAPVNLSFDDTIVDTDVEGWRLNDREMALCGLGPVKREYTADRIHQQGQTNPTWTDRRPWDPPPAHKEPDLIKGLLVNPRNGIDRLGRQRIKLAKAEPGKTDVNGVILSWDEKMALHIEIPPGVAKQAHDQRVFRRQTKAKGTQTKAKGT